MLFSRIVTRRTGGNPGYTTWQQWEADLDNPEYADKDVIWDAGAFPKIVIRVYS